MSTKTIHEGCGGTLVDTAEGAVRCAACDAQFTPCADPECDALIGPDDGGNYVERSDGKAGLYCDSCHEADLMHPSVLTRFAKGGQEKVIFGNVFAIGPDGSETPEWFDALLPTVTRVWKSTDAWRGYYNTIEVIDGVTDLAHGWATGDYPDVPWKRMTHTLMEVLEVETPPVPIYVLSEPTSNVFSTAVDLFTLDADHDAAVKWLRRRGLAVESLQEAFR